jgi:electron transport complex protein RnfG
MRRHLPILISGVLLGLFGVLGAGLVGLSHEGTAERIARNEREALLHQIHVLVPREQIDNDMLNDVIEVSAPDTLGVEKTRVYLGRRNGEPVAAVLSPVSTPGYAGPIQLVVAVRYDGTLAGVRVLSHRETPGLGDKIEEERSDWILSFDGKSLLDPRPSEWKVKRDGGVFDQFTGATVTPRTIVRAVKTALEYFDANRLDLFETGQQQGDQNSG